MAVAVAVAVAVPVPMPRRRPATAASQLDFGFRRPRPPKRGRPKKPGAGVAHARRQVDPRHPLHVTLRVRRHVWQLRSRRCYRILEKAFFAAAARAGARVAQFSVQHNHVHLLVEAADATALARALQGMCIRMAKGLNALMDRHGAVFADRYHSRSLRTPTEVRHALVYVLCNARKHLRQLGRPTSASWIDDYSSGAWFDGWMVPVRPPPSPPPVRPATTWLLATGWRLRGGGPIGLDEVPAGRRAKSQRSASRAASSASR